MMEIKFKKILLLFGFVVACCCQSWSASIVFKIQDSDNQLLKNASITCFNQSGIDFTQEKGIFKANNLAPKKYIFLILCDFYKQKRIEVTIASPDEVAERIITLEKEEITLDTIVLTRIDLHHLGEVHDDELLGSKKNESTDIEELTANKSTNNPNQVFYRSPLTNVVQTDGAGIQMGIGGRGLDPHRSSNFNIRQNGYDISADALGYPESYYTPPTEALDKIEVLRGAASLQFGTQFGGVVNFKLKNSYDKPFQFRTRQTLGSFGLFNSFNSIGGSKENGLKYFAFYQRKSGNDYRPNSEFGLNTFHGHLEFPLSQKVILGIDQTYMNYLAHQPGGLTDAEFEKDPRQSNRERNWFEIKWYVPSLALSYFPSANWLVTSKFFGLMAHRNSVGNLGPIDRIDDPNSNRDVILGQFKNIGNETRAIYSYQIKDNTSHLSMGYRLYFANNLTLQGIGTNGSDANFTVLNDNTSSRFNFPNKNVALFAENLFHLSPKFSITPGVRVEHINTSSKGYYRTKTTDLAGNVLQNFLTNESQDLPRTFAIAGVGASYKLLDSISVCEIYTNFTQNYRSVTYSDIRVNNPTLVIDSLIHDERGYNFDFGIRGEKPTVFDYDFSVFALRYNDRIGEVLRKVTDQNGLTNTKRFRSNISDAVVYGIEFFGEYNLLKLWSDSTKNALNWFVNSAIIQSQYINSSDPSIEGNKVEYAPNFNLKTGLICKLEKFSSTLQFNYTSSQFSDASNADDHPSAFVGIVPSYFILDWAFAYKINKYFRAETGVNNLTNTSYFTKRATGYPGPGILPASGRNFYFTLEFRI